MLDPLTALENEFRPNAAFSHDTGMLLLEAADAQEFIRRGIQLGGRLAGVESFLIVEGAIQPEQDFSNDVADVAMEQAEFVRETLELVARGGREGYVFEVVFDPW